jgi:hypothetical protein
MRQVLLPQVIPIPLCSILGYKDQPVPSLYMPGFQPGTRSTLAQTSNPSGPNFETSHQQFLAPLSKQGTKEKSVGGRGGGGKIVIVLDALVWYEHL